MVVLCEYCKENEEKRLWSLLFKKYCSLDCFMKGNCILNFFIGLGVLVMGFIYNFIEVELLSGITNFAILFFISGIFLMILGMAGLFVKLGDGY